MLCVFGVTGATTRSFSQQVVAVPAATALFVREYKLDSKLMKRQMPYQLVLPENYDAPENKNKKYPVVYLLHGLTGHYNNWGDKTKISQFLAPYNFIVVMPEGNDGWYTDSATVPNDRYESYITQELIPEIDKNFRTFSDRNNRIIAGLSMGGYGSLKFGLKESEMFGMVGSFSGALGAASWTDKILGRNWAALTDSIMSVYGAEGSQTRRENDIFQLVKDITPEKAKTLPFVYLDCGTEDGLIQSNRDFSALLLEKKIPHEFRELPGAHTWTYWEQQIQDFLRLSDRFFKSKNKSQTAYNNVKDDEAFCTLGEQKLGHPISADLIKTLPSGKINSPFESIN